MIPALVQSFSRHAACKTTIRMLAVPRMPPFDRRATYEDLEKLPPELVAEIVDGELHASPRPAPRHAWASSRLMSRVGPPYADGHGGPGGWVILVEPEVHFRQDVLVPDLAGWRRARLPRLPATAFFSVAPDWVCEVISPSTVALDRAKKLSIYGREGVCHLWLIDPVARVVEVFRLVRRRWTVAATHAGNEIVRLEPFNEFELDLSALWSDEAAAPAAERAKRPPRPGRPAR